MATNGEDGSIDLAALSERLDTINRVVRQAQSKTQTPQTATTAASSSDSAASASDTNTNTIATAISDDTNPSASDVAESKAPAIDELTLDDETTTDEDRDKR